MPDKTSHTLEHGYKITKIGRKEHIMLLRDKQENPLAVIETCCGKISHIKSYNGQPLSAQTISVISNFARRKAYLLTEETAHLLNLNIVQRDGQESYYKSEELTTSLLKQIFTGFDSLILTINDLHCHRLTIPSATHKCTLKLNNLQTAKLFLKRQNQATIDLRDNRFVEKLVVENGFCGNINFSRSCLKELRVGDNCRTNIMLSQGKNSLRIYLGNVYSGILEVIDSSIETTKIGSYCYGKIRMNNNSGNKNIILGNSFRGTMSIDSIIAENMHIGKDCRGTITIQEEQCCRGIKNIAVDNSFGGKLQLSSALSLQKIDVGAQSSGQIDLSGCPSIQTVSLEKNFSGKIDLQRSGIMYVTAQQGCKGKLILLNCNNLSLLQLPKDKKAEINLEKKPQTIETGTDSISYRFNDDKIPVALLSSSSFPQKIKQFITHYFT